MRWAHRAFDGSISRFVKMASVEVIRDAFMGETWNQITEDGLVCAALYGEEEYAEVVNGRDCEIDVLRMVVESRGREIEDLKVQIAALKDAVSRLTIKPMKYVAIDSLAGC